MNRSHFFVLLIALFTLSGAIAQEEITYESFGEKVDALRIDKHIPGLSGAIVKDGKIAWSHGFGFADSNSEVPVTPNTPFWTASVTKTFVGLAYLHLQQEGLVDLGQLGSETPEFSELCDWLEAGTIPFAEGLVCDEPISIRHILHHQVNKPIGSIFLYNPIMYSRLSRHLEHSLGEGVRQVEGRHNYLAQSIDKYILEPAGMTRTMASMWDSSKTDVYFDLADGFAIDEDGYKDRLKRPERHIAGGAGVVSTVLDLAKYHIAISNGSIAPDDIGVQLNKAAKFNDGSDSPYGFGWYFQCYSGERLMWHGGWDPDNGYSAILLRLVDRDMAFVLLANSEGLWWDNPPGKAEIESSAFVQLFFDQIGFDQSQTNACPTVSR